jgi:hypothetical protein
LGTQCRSLVIQISCFRFRHRRRRTAASIPPWFDFAGYQFVIRAPNIEAVERFAAAFGYLARQEAVGYHRVEPITVGEHAEWLALHELPEEVRPQVLSQTNAVEIELDHAATVEEVKRLYNAIGRIAEQLKFDRDDLPIIPTRRGLRILNFSNLDGTDFVGAIWEAVGKTLGERRIFPLKIVEGDLVSNLWKEHPYGEAYLQKLVGTDVRGVTAAAARQTAGGTERVGTPRQEHLATSEGRPDVSGDFSRVADIYATEVRPLEERFYEWLRGLRDLAREGKWEQIDPELQPFARKLLRVLRDQPTAPGAAATAEARSEAPPSTTTSGSTVQVTEPQATAQRGAAPVRVRKPKGQTKKKAAPQQAKPAGPEPASAAESPEPPKAPQRPEATAETPTAGEEVAPTSAEAAAAASPSQAAPETPPASGLQPRHKALEDAVKQRDLLAQWRNSLLDNRSQQLQEIQNRIRGRQLKENLRTIAGWQQNLEKAGENKAINELQRAFTDTLGSLPVEALADPTEVALHWLASTIRRISARDPLRQDVRDWWSTIIGDENESRVRLRAIEHMREALLRNDQEAQSILDQALPRSTQRVQTLYEAIERYIRESTPGDEVATALRRAFAELPAAAFTETQEIVSKFMPLVKEYGGAQGLEGFNPTLVRFCRELRDIGQQARRTFQSHLGSILPLHLQKHAPKLLLRFNPTLVRFCLAKVASPKPDSYVSIPPWFDFATDTDEAVSPVAPVSIPPWFDFAGRGGSLGRLGNTRFNPTLVRFCRGASPPPSAANAVSIPPWFDFADANCQLTSAACRVSIPPWFDFALPCKQKRHPRALVSIPPWFDFATAHSNAPTPPCRVSIPPWFDFALGQQYRSPAAAHVSIPPWFDFASSPPAAQSCAAGRFQSHLGSILPWAPKKRASCASRFQSHLGSILPHKVRPAPPANNSFNPTLVRFCRCRVSTSATRLRVSIPPWFDFAWVSAHDLYVPLSVSIPPWFDFALHSDPIPTLPQLGFNPTLVRFCQNCDTTGTSVCSSFNPTLVRFCPQWAGTVSLALLRSFNPTLVRFCQGRAWARAALDDGFNPTLVRFCRC